MDLDTKDDGKVPRGMEITHQDDDEGGRGIDNDADAGLLLDNEDAGDSKELTNANLDPARRASDAVAAAAQRQPKPEEARGPAANPLQIPDDSDDDDDDDEDEAGEEGEGEGANGNNEEDDDEEDDDEDDDDEDDDDEEGGTEQRPKKKKRRMKVNKYVDIEVEVDEDEDEEDDEEAGEAGYEEAAADIARGPGGRRGMIVPDTLSDDEGATGADERDHRDYERRARDREEAEAQRIAREYKERHRQRRGTGIGALQALGEFAPKNVLVPSVDDPSIWRVKCKIGRERELVMSISRKAIAEDLQITSAFQRDSFHGHLYVEARSEAHVKDAIKGLIGIYGGTPLALVPIEEMPDLLKSRRKETPLTVGGWVRIKRGTYKGDLAQVDDVPEGTDMVTLKVVPRINLNPKDDIDMGGDSQVKKRRRAETSMFRPAPKFFNADEVRQAYAGRSKIVKDAEGFHFERELYANGYLIKDFRLTAIDRENINPTIDEITRFMGETNAAAAAAGDASGTIGTGGNKLDLDLVAEAARAQAVLQPGDYIEIYEGSQKGIIGTVDSVIGNVLTISPTEPADLAGTKIEVLAHQVRKRFKVGDHVKVMRGKNVNESGLVLKIQDDLVTFLSDLSIQEVTVFSKDIREAAEVGTGSSSSSQYELHDLVQLDADTVGVIFKIDPSTFRVIDQNGTIRSIRPNQISNKLDTRRSVATDSEGYELRNGDSVKEIARGTREPRQGRVLHVHRSLYAFLHNRDIVENGGVFVTYARSLGSIVPRGTKAAGPGQPGFDPSRMNPNIMGPNGGMGPPAAPAGAPRGREVAVGLAVTVIKGNHKGYKGIIKDLNGPLARVELHTNMKTITIERNKLGTKNHLGQDETLASWEANKMARRSGGIAYANGGGYAPSPHAFGRPGQTPNGNTPATSAYSSGKTPMPRGGATPFGGAYGGATPFGGAGGATPFGAFGAGSATPYASGRTPAYGGRDSFAASSATPFTASGSNAFSANSRTPYNSAAGGGSGFGGATPYGGTAGGSAPRDVWASASPAYQPNPSTSSDPWESASPAYNAASSSSYGATNMGTSAPTPAETAATPAPSAWDSVDPPYRSSASQADPWASAQPDSGPSYNSAPTPAAPSTYLSAPTPAADSTWDVYSAPTPAASAPTPYASAATPAGGDPWE